MKQLSVLLITVLIAFILMTACIAEENTSAVEGNTTAPLKVTVGDILGNATQYTDKTVELSGKITSQCGSGCWFILSDDTGDLYTTLLPNNFVIPPAMGKIVTVAGVLKIEGTDVSLIGTKVLLDGKSYP